VTGARPRIVALVSVVLLFAAGCNGDALSEEEFLERANEICAAGNVELGSMTNDLEDELGGENPTDAQLTDFADAVSENLRDQVAGIRALEGPSDLEEQLDPLLDEVEQYATDLAAKPENLVTDERFDEATGQLVDLGLTECH
jgi:hypothetical protein